MAELQGFIYIFICIVIGAVLVGAIADSTYENTTPLGSFNETIDISSARFDGYNVTDTVGFTVKAVTAGREITVINWWKLEDGTELVESTDYTNSIDTDGKLYLINSTAFQVDHQSNVTVIDYDYEGEGYVSNSTARVLIGLFTLFFAVGLVVFIIMYIKKKYIDTI